MQKLRVGIFFGGPSREREISFRGGKTAYENIDKAIFEPILIFVDSLGNFIHVEKDILQETEIRNFYPSRNLNRGFPVYIESLGQLNETQLYKLIYKIGKQVKPQELSEMMDFAFAVMHGPHAEDGSIQGMLEWLGIPYMGPGILGSAVGINKYYQNGAIGQSNGQKKTTLKISKDQWDAADKKALMAQVIDQVGFPIVIKAPHQGSSIGVSIVKKRSLEEFVRGIEQCFFEMKISQKEWTKLTQRQKKNIVQRISNLDEGIGFPVVLNGAAIAHPADLITALDGHLGVNESATVASANAEDFVIAETFIQGREFSCGVVQDDDGTVIPLPPTEIYSEGGTFDFKSKYVLGTTKKRIPIDTSIAVLEKLHEDLAKIFTDLGMGVVVRVDGFLTDTDQVLFHDPNTLPGMSPASLIFKQMGEIGLNITQSISYLIRQSLRERIRSGKNTHRFRELLKHVDLLIEQSISLEKERVIVLFEETDDQYAEAKKWFNKTAASAKYRPIGVLLTASGELYKLPVNLMMKDHVADVKVAIAQPKHTFLTTCIQKAKPLAIRYLGKEFDSEVHQIDEVALLNAGSLLYTVQTGELTKL